MEKVIHYCWFGKKPLPKLAKKCIASWKKYCPDYTIKEWNEDNFDVNCCQYVREAYAAGKYAFVSDYARYWILFQNGGLYFDTDVELIKPIQEVVEKGNFMGCETNEPDVTVNPGLGMGSEKGLDFYALMLSEYEKSNFLNEDGTYNLLNIVSRTTEKLLEYGLVKNNDLQIVAGINIYPKEYFNPCDMQTGKIVCTDKTYSIHHYAASWVSKKDKFRGKAYQILNRIVGKKLAKKIKSLFRK